ncbi:extracellular solute-binding protein [Paenibacillus aurantius]|uniref:Extracellular solute-binding protein n=1 Tax=Paenibacillus aurantius TaxID=2918900 RepID=A0AA96LC73_9BACL|nr:extracellular solute-binding protein [Paenibacillus aurantius]WNQ10463.1 extracellular solute-binding protein [Paenibacillus aurantius]
MKKKWTVLLVTSSLCLGTALSACSKSEPAASPQSTSPAGTAANAPKKLHVLLSHSEAAYAKQAKDDDPYVKELSKLSGYDLKFEFLGHADYGQQLSLRFASGELADLVRTDSINSTNHSGAVDQGVFQELGPLIDKYAPSLKKKIPETAWKSPRVTKDGKIYGIPVGTGMPADGVVFIRQDWLDKLHMSMPKTLDDYLKFFEGVKKEDMNGNGDPNDEYGIGIFNSFWGDYFIPAFGVHPGLFNLRDGKLTPDFLDPKMKDAIAFWKKLYDNGYVNPNLFTKKEDEHNASIAKGEVGSWGAAVYQYSAGYGKDNAPKTFINQPGASISMAEAPKGPDGKGGIGVQGDGIYFVWVIPSKSKNVEESLKFLEWAWTSPEAEKFYAYGIKGVNYTEENGKINYDSSAPANADKNAFQMYQLSLNMKEIGFASPLVLKVAPEADKLIKGYETASRNMIKHDGLYMPRLKSLSNKPELALGLGSSNLFTDMFAKVVTGKAPLDSAFDNFVADWKKRGGDEVIQEATEWYNSFHKK